jgi:phosphoribosyl-AMP cyclohydrolase
MADNAPMDWLDDVKWNDEGLVPVIAQEAESGDVLMLAWMNREALRQTVELGQAVYFSRSRQSLWHKGESSGHFQTVHEVRMDCDNDVLLMRVTQHGHSPTIACHTGRHSCFFKVQRGGVVGGAWEVSSEVIKDPEMIYR